MCACVRVRVTVASLCVRHCTCGHAHCNPPLPPTPHPPPRLPRPPCQVAFKRIQDEVPMAIRRSLLRRLGDRKALEAALKAELPGPDVAAGEREGRQAGLWQTDGACRSRAGHACMHACMNTWAVVSCALLHNRT